MQPDSCLLIACLKQFLEEFESIQRELYDLSSKTVRAVVKAIRYYC
jgi:hypothetical protein